MQNYYIQNKKMIKKVSGFVLPYTLFLSAIMILVTTSVSSTLLKQIYFSRLARQSQAAYYAADNAVMCAIIIDSTYTNSLGDGIFPFKPESVISTIPASGYITEMQSILDDVNSTRGSNPLAEGDFTKIKCAGSLIFDTSLTTSNFTVGGTFTRQTDSGPEDGRTSSFKMKMNVGDGTSRCANVTINKTPTYRQIIAQGYALCNDKSVQRAIVNTTFH